MSIEDKTNKREKRNLLESKSENIIKNLKTVGTRKLPKPKTYIIYPIYHKNKAKSVYICE